MGIDYNEPGYQQATDLARPVGTPTCVGGYDGLHDLSGNVWEWENSCRGPDLNDGCRMRGGALMLHVSDAPLARATKNIDFLGRLDNSLENLERVVREVCTADVEPDGMLFAPDTVKTERIHQSRVQAALLGELALEPSIAHGRTISDFIHRIYVAPSGAA